MTLYTDNAIAPTSNLMNSDDLGVSVRDVTAEKRAKGHFNVAENYIQDADANNNTDIVTRDGSRMHAGGEYQPNDILMIEGMEVTYEMAQSLGLIRGSEFTSPQDEFLNDSENVPEVAPVDDRPAEAALLSDQFEIAFGENGEKALDLIGQDIVMNGDLSESGLNFLNEKMNVSEARFLETFSEMQEVGGHAMYDFLETGDGLGLDRVDFLVDLSETGTRDQQAAVRSIWVKAIQGKLTRDQAIEAFNELWEPYDA